MLNEDGAVPSFPCWTSHSLFSLNTRPGLAIHRRDCRDGDIPRLRLLESIHALKPFHNSGHSLDHDRFPIPANEIRSTVLCGSLSNYHDELSTSDQSPVTRRLKRRRRELRVWEHDGPLVPEDSRTRGCLESQNSLMKFDNMLPTLQRKAWMSFSSSLKTPIPFSTLRSVLSERDLCSGIRPSSSPLQREDQLSQNTSETYRRGNLLAHYKTGAESIFVLATSGMLDSVTAYSISTNSSDPSPSVQIRKYASCQKMPDVLAVEEPIFNMVALPYSDANEAARLLATTSNSVSLARIFSDGILKWEDHVDVPNVRSSALNPFCPEEFSVLSSEGLFSGDADELRSWRKSPEVYRKCFHDVQCLLPDAQYRQVEYGIHPRTRLLASRKELIHFDLRARIREESLAIFDLRRKPEIQARDSEIGSFCFAPNTDGFRLLLATRASLLYFDIRKPEVPLLDWSLVFPYAPDKMCAFPRNPDGMRSDVVLLGSSWRGHTDVFHAVHTGRHDALAPFHKAGESEMYQLPKMELAWSDLPLSIYSMSTFQDNLDGVIAVPDSGDRRATVLQWSGRTGLTLHLLEVSSYLEPECGTVEVYQKKPAESSVNLNNSMWSIAPFTRERCSCDHFPVSRSVPGSYLHGRIKRLLLRDVEELRKRLCSAEDDDRDTDGSRFVPRPYMHDLFASKNCNGDSISMSSSPEEGTSSQTSSSQTSSSQTSSAQRSQREPHGDDTEDRETLNREAALLRSEESDDSDNPNSSYLDFVSTIGSGCLFDELSRLVRSGFGHQPMPLGVSALMEAVSDSPLTKSYETTWHMQCERVHSPDSTAVTTTDTLPGWLCTTVYFTEEAEKGDSLQTSSIPEASQYGVLLARMQTEFFD